MNTQEILRSVEAEYLKSNLPELYIGDTIKVGVKIKEGDKERVQPYEGIIIARRHSGINETITVRRVFQGVGVERVFLLHSPKLDNIVVVRRGRVRRAKLFYLRDRVGKATRVKQRFDRERSTSCVLSSVGRTLVSKTKCRGFESFRARF
jgi:large subunit ribosomal protein L19